MRVSNLPYLLPEDLNSIPNPVRHYILLRITEHRLSWHFLFYVVFVMLIILHNTEFEHWYTQIEFQFRILLWPLLMNSQQNDERHLCILSLYQRPLLSQATTWKRKGPFSVHLQEPPLVFSLFKCLSVVQFCLNVLSTNIPVYAPLLQADRRCYPK